MYNMGSTVVKTFPYKILVQVNSMRYHRNPLPVILFAFAFLIPVSLSHADRLILENGNSIEGIVEKEGDTYVVEFSTGKMKIHESEVKEVIKEETDLQRFRKRHEQINEQDADAHYELGVWAQTHGLYKQSQQEFRHAIQRNPDHTRARQELGFVKKDGQWMTREEKMRREGYVQYQGEWMTPEVKQARIQRQDQLEEQNQRIQQLQEQLRNSRNQVAQLENKISDLRLELRNERLYNRRIRYYPIFPYPNRDRNKHHSNPHKNHWTRKDNGNTVITEQTNQGEVWKEVLPNGQTRIIHRPGDGHSVHKQSDDSKVLKGHKDQSGNQDIELIHPKHHD